MKYKRRLSHIQIIALGFLLMILIGTGLLMLPVSTKDGMGASFLDALFTATSASCVTGLVMKDTATYWSTFGHVVIILLIQIGGLGFMTIATLFFLAFKRRVGLRSRAVMMESISYSSYSDVMPFVRRILIGTAIFEGGGAICLSFKFIPEYGPVKGICYSIFHAISAFCNAGFDLMGEKEQFCSFVPYAGDWWINLVLMFLIVVGGLGFMVWDDLRVKKLDWRRYSLQTKLVLTVSFVLTFGGAILFFFLERNNLGKDLPLNEQILTALFDSVTARTAGFNTTDTGALTGASKLLTILLMVVGGSSGSTAGGAKTTTLAVIVVYTICGLKGDQQATVFGRRLEDDTLKKATFVLFTNLFLALGGAIVISCIQSLDIVDVMFETFSAIGTVGMTTGITRDLAVGSRIVIILLMYLGRVGSISFGTALLEKRAKPPITAPAENILVG